MIEVEVLGAQALDEQTLPRAKVRRLCLLAAAAGGVEEGHVAIEIVDAERIALLNAAHRGKAGPTDVLSFPIDGAGPMNAACSVDAGGFGSGVVDARPGASGPVDRTPSLVEGVPRELGDVVICPEHTVDLCEAVVHGVLHLVGMDHETDAGEMLALQAELLRWEALVAADASAPSA